MPQDKTAKITAMAREKSERREAEVLATIEKMVRSKEKVSFYSVSKKTGSSKTYLYGNEAISARIRELRGEAGKPGEGDQTADVVIKGLRKRVRELERENAELHDANSDSYKAKYEALRKENAELNKQLRAAYSYVLPTE